jgi:aminopeptidase-like protein
MTGESILELTRDLCEYATGVVAPDNERLFARIADELPINVLSYPSGSSHNGWVVPELWRVERATISRNGRELFDGTVDPLAVAAYSHSFSGELDLEELRPHLVTSERFPEAYVYHCMWQYRPWDADWALSVPYDLYRKVEAGSYRVELETSREPGEMLVAELELPGRSERTIVFNAHTCHPRMANDDFAGVAVLIRLFQWLQKRDLSYTYRLVLGPEHLGTVFYLRDQPEEALERFVCGVFSEMPGTSGPLTIASSFLGNQPVDRALANAARHCARAARFVPWRLGAGNDETVWEAPGYEVPFVEVSRSEDVLAPFPEYHTSRDRPELLDVRQLEEFAAVLRRMIEILEQNAVAYRRFDGLICLSNPEYGLYRERPDPAVAKELASDSEKWGYLADSLLRYFDGSLTVLEIAEKHELSFEEVLAYVRRFEEKGLVTLEPALIERVPISRPREAVRES